MDERYPIGETASTAVAVLRHSRPEAGYGQWSVTIALRSGEATLRVPGHYAPVLAARLRGAEARFPRGGRLGRDEYLDVTAIEREGEQTLALSSSVRSPVRVSVEVPREELEPLAELLETAGDVVETLREGIGGIPDRLPEPG
jgi:hypothetical protein